MNSKDIVRVTVIVPVYNTEKYLNLCITSILQQSFEKFILLLIDDGSTDKSGKICDKYEKLDKRIRVIHQKNRGLINTRLRGISLADTEYVTFVDSDDWIDEDMLKNLICPLLENPEIDISVSPHIRNNGKTENIIFATRGEGVWSSDEAVLNVIQNKWLGWSMCGKIYRRRLFDNIVINNPDNPMGEDLAFNWILLKKARKVYYMPCFMYHYVQHSDSMVHIDGDMKYLGFLDRISNIIENESNPLLVEMAAYIFCTNGVDFLLSVLIWGGEDKYCDLTKYQHLLSKYHNMIGKALTSSRERQYQYALMDKNDLRKMVYEREREIANKCREFGAILDEVFIYGIGKIAGEIAKVLLKYNISFSGFAVSQNINDVFMEKPVSCYRELIEKSDGRMGIILALNERNTEEVLLSLKDYPEVRCINVGIFSVSY